jgi:hypothetical protein
MSDGNNYYRKRIEEELAAADRAGDSSIALIHREMAERYRELLKEQSEELADAKGVMQPAGGQLAELGALHG